MTTGFQTTGRITVFRRATDSLPGNCGPNSYFCV